MNYNKIIKQYKSYIDDLYNELNSIEIVDLDEFENKTLFIKNKIEMHNNLLNEWFDNKFKEDLNNLKTSIISFNLKIDTYNKNQYLQF